MRVLSCTLINFASYERLDFNFENSGLCLIAGPTGAGKSTLCDAIPWVLFGRTAKDGTVDEVRSWNAKGSTVGIITVETPGGTECTVYRSRGPNDLYFTINGIEPRRGKDLADTQRLINQAVGISVEAYLASAYFHEFSPTAQFFSAPAKAKRALLEQVVDLGLNKSIQEGVAASKKATKADLDTLLTEINSTATKLRYINSSIDQSKERWFQWEISQEAKIAAAQTARASFEQDKKAEIKALQKKQKAFKADLEAQIGDVKAELREVESTIRDYAHFAKAKADLEVQIAIGGSACPMCGASKDHTRKMLLAKELHQVQLNEAKNAQTVVQAKNLQAKIDRLAKSEDPFAAKIEAKIAETNTYDALIASLQAETNPHNAATKRLEADRDEATAMLRELNEMADELKVKASDLSILSDLVETHRGLTIKATVQAIQDQTNTLLTKHFDAEIRVSFTIENDADKLDVTLFKDGNEASFTQLSKGQRQLLKLCFGVSMMKHTANHQGLRISTVFFDECVDGLSEDLKVKAFGLFRELETQYENVFVVEHSSALKSLFENAIEVSLNNGISTIHRT